MILGWQPLEDSLNCFVKSVKLCVNMKYHKQGKFCILHGFKANSKSFPAK